MKCPKCGEDLDTGLNCYKCGYSDTKKIELEPTIAENLLCVIKKCLEKQCLIFMTDKVVSIRTPVKGFDILYNEEKFSLKNGLDEAIQQAYKWAKENSLERVRAETDNLCVKWNCQEIL